MPMNKKVPNKNSKEAIFGGRSTPRGFYNYAKVYHDAFEELEKLSENTVRFYPATYFLASRSIELALKSVLRFYKYSLDELARDKFGHNLTNLVRENEDKGYLTLSEKEKEIIKSTDYWYKSKQYEYQITGLKQLPKSEDLSFVCVKLLDKSKAVIGS